MSLIYWTSTLAGKYEVPWCKLSWSQEVTPWSSSNTVGKRGRREKRL